MDKIIGAIKKANDSVIDYEKLTDEQMEEIAENVENACENKSRSKIRISRWLGIEPAERYHALVLLWHDFRRKIVDILSEAEEEQEDAE